MKQWRIRYERTWEWTEEANTRQEALARARRHKIIDGKDQTRLTAAIDWTVAHRESEGS